MSDQNGASAFNQVTRYPYYNVGKTVYNAREREFPIKEKAPNLGKRRGRGEGGVGETRREREKPRFSLSRRVSPESRVTTQKQKISIKQRTTHELKTICPQKIKTTFYKTVQGNALKPAGSEGQTPPHNFAIKD